VATARSCLEQGGPADAPPSSSCPRTPSGVPAGANERHYRPEDEDLWAVFCVSPGRLRSRARGRRVAAGRGVFDPPAASLWVRRRRVASATTLIDRRADERQQATRNEIREMKNIKEFIIGISQRINTIYTSITASLHGIRLQDVPWASAPRRAQHLARRCCFPDAPIICSWRVEDTSAGRHAPPPCSPTKAPGKNTKSAPKTLVLGTVVPLVGLRGHPGGGPRAAARRRSTRGAALLHARLRGRHGVSPLQKGRLDLASATAAFTIGARVHFLAGCQWRGRRHGGGAGLESRGRSESMRWAMQSRGTRPQDVAFRPVRPPRAEQPKTAPKIPKESAHGSSGSRWRRRAGVSWAVPERGPVAGLLQRVPPVADAARGSRVAERGTGGVRNRGVAGDCAPLTCKPAVERQEEPSTRFCERDFVKTSR
jgi:hypothetical protein